MQAGGQSHSRGPRALASDQEALLRILARHNVRLVVIGGVGAQFHGWNSATVDLDIAIDRGDENVARFNRALAEMEAGQPEYGQFGTAFNTKYGRLEIVRKADGIGEYDDWLRNATEKDLDDLVIVVADAKDILASKEAAGRDKDVAVIGQMRKELETPTDD